MWQEATTGRWSGVTGDSYRRLWCDPWMVVDFRYLQGGKRMLILAWLVMAILTAIAANAKNRSAIAGFLVGACFPLAGLIGFLIVKPLPQRAGSVRKGLLVTSAGERECPHCAELIKMQASKCKHCSADVAPITEEQVRVAHSQLYEPMRRSRTLIVCAIGVVIVTASYLYQS